jgi:hypothetical protein
MRFSAPAVVAAWGLLNAALAATLAGFGAQAVVIAIYASAAALVEIAAVVVWIALRRAGTPRAWPEPPDGDSVLLFAAAVIVAGLGVAFAWYLALLALLPLTGAVLREVSARRGGLTE